tara:strand:+ start:9605 stop:10249 length:645 start_codon:yes stop_codon:yes gene_type:complete
MKNYLFLSLKGSLVTQECCSGELETLGSDECWVMNLYPPAVNNLNLLVSELPEIKIILTDVPTGFNSRSIHAKFSGACFKYLNNIIGKCIRPSSIITKVRGFNENPISDFPIFSGNLIEHFKQNFLHHPYKYDDRLKPAYEVWNYPNNENNLSQPEFIGLREDALHDDFNYLILGHFDGLLTHQISHHIETDMAHGITQEIKNKILNYFKDGRQ